MEGKILSKMLRNGGGIQTSVIVSCNFYELCKRHRIKFSEALRVGISLMLAEMGIEEYDNNLNITRKIKLLTNQLSETSEEMYNLKEKLEKKEGKDGKQ